MIWFFLAGYIAGVVGVVMLLFWWIKKHTIKVTPEQMKNNLEEMEREKS